MRTSIKEVQRNYVDDDDTRAPSVASSEREQYGMAVIDRLVYFIGGVIMSIIALRILLSLLGANRSNMFADFIYSVSYPFVAPFFGLFNYDVVYGVSRFEFESVIALLVVGLVTAAIARLVTLGSRRADI